MQGFVKEKLLQIKDIIFSDFVLLDRYNNLLFRTDENSNYSNWHMVDLSDYRIIIKEKVSAESLRFIQVILSALESQILETKTSKWHKLLFGETVDMNEIDSKYKKETDIHIWIILANEITKHLEVISMLFEMSIPLVISDNKVAIIHFEDYDTDSPESVLNHIESELMIKCKIVIGNKVNSIEGISKSYTNANDLLKHIFKTNSSKAIFRYDDMLIENLIGKMEEKELENIYSEYCKLNDIDKLNHELIETIKTFFENNLNITDTATNLFLHRNTLIYRLNRIQASTSLDIRKFEDALKMKIMLLIKNNI